jgi:hypothetical protein
MSINTPPDAKSVTKAFKRNKLLFNILWYSGCLLVAVGLISRRVAGSYTGLPENAETWVFIGASVPLLVGAIFAWRCPVCKRFFWTNTRVTACSKCKTVFVGGDKGRIF